MQDIKNTGPEALPVFVLNVYVILSGKMFKKVKPLTYLVILIFSKTLDFTQFSLHIIHTYLYLNGIYKKFFKGDRFFIIFQTTKV